MTDLARTAALFVVTAIAEIVGCWLAWRVMRGGASPWLLLPGAAALAAFAWLLTLHPAASGRVYAAYGGVYVAVALVWLRLVDGARLGPTDWIGAALAFAGMAVIAWGWRSG